MCVFPLDSLVGGGVHSLGIIEGCSERGRDHSAGSSVSVLLPSDLLESSTEHVPQSWGCSLLPPPLAGLVEHVMHWAWTAGLAGEGTPGLAWAGGLQHVHMRGLHVNVKNLWSLTCCYLTFNICRLRQNPKTESALKSATL